MSSQPPRPPAGLMGDPFAFNMANPGGLLHFKTVLTLCEKHDLLCFPFLALNFTSLSFGIFDIP